jgi:tetratricopeptide (TPR) repeat protein
MRTATCQRCHQTSPIGELAKVKDQAMCPPCVEDYVEASGDGATAEGFPRLDDPSICVECQKDNGTATLPLFAGRPICDECLRRKTRAPISVLIALLSVASLAVVALAAASVSRSAAPARRLFEAERLMSKGHYRQAVPELQKAIDLDRGLVRARLLLIEALLLSDQLPRAKAEMERVGEPTGRLAEKVKATAERVDKAILDQNTAFKAFHEGKTEQAAELIRRARRGFPESRRVAAAYLLIMGVFAFENGETGSYVESHDLLGRMMPKDVEAVALRAVAVAGRFALEGKEEDRTLARELLKSAGELARTGDEEDLVRSARREIQYRLAARELRRFPAKSK